MSCAIKLAILFFSSSSMTETTPPYSIKKPNLFYLYLFFPG